MATAAPKHDRSKTAIIVGASRGLGLGLARGLARRGWHVTATVRNASIAPELADDSVVLQRLAAGTLKGKASKDFAPEGITWTLACPATAVVAVQ